MFPLKILVVSLASALALSAHAAGDPVAGKQKTAMCQGCHGIAGWKTAFPEVYSVPKLGGQHPAYLLASLKAYKRGERDQPSMRAIAADLSDKDLEDLAAYYGTTAPASAGKK